MKLQGVIVPNLTPMNASGDALDLDSVEPLVAFLAGAGVNALFVNGTTGEGPLLNLSERKALAEAFIGAAKGRLPVVVQVGSLSTQESLELAVHAAEHRVDAVACVTPFYFGYGEEELEHFYTEVAQAIDPCPLYLYNIPSRTGNAISPPLAARLAKFPNVAGIKDSSGDIGQLLGLLEIPEFAVVPGADHLIVQMLQLGAPGFVSGPASVLPEPYVALWKAWQAKDAEGVLEWQHVIMRYSKAVRFGARIDLLKALAAKRLGYLGSVRAPLSAANDELLAPLCSSLKRVLAESSLPEEAYGWL